MSSVPMGVLIVAYRFRMKGTDQKTWLKSKREFTTFEGAHQAAKAAASKHALMIRHRVVFDVLGEVEELS